MNSFLFYLLISTIATFNCFCQTKEEKQQDDYLKLVWDSNLAYDLNGFYNQTEIKSRYRINKELNPFYLRGDFDGDKKMDYALAVIEAQTGKKGILIYHPKGKRYFRLGAGKRIPDGYNLDDLNWMDAWKIYDKKEVELGVSETKKLKVKGEAIMVYKLESSSGLIYWDGKGYRWYQQGD